MPEPPEVMGYKIDTDMPLHRLFVERMKNDRDLKIIITAEDSETGVGKTTCAGWLALSWNPMFTGDEWQARDYSCIDPNDFFEIQANSEPGSVLIMDDAEELDARRSMASENVEFSQRWMLMRVLGQVHILTLPSPAALDSRLEELADVWINIKNRGVATVHNIKVNSYGSRGVMTPKVHEMEFPNVSDHPELQELHDIKQERIDKKITDKEEDMSTPDAKEIRREQKIELAQKLRDTTEMTLQEIADSIGMSKGWVSNNTEKQVEGVV